MRMINKKLIVSDFDGTLIDDKNEISDKVRKAIEDYVSCGGVFAVCTGRMLLSILPRVRELGLKGLVAAYQGSVVADIESGEILTENCLSVDDGVDICAYAEKFGYASDAYKGEYLYTNLPVGNERIAMYEKVTGVKANYIDGSMSEYLRQNNISCNKITFLVYHDEREKLYKLLYTQFAERFDVTCGALYLVEVSPKGDDKGSALKYIARHFNIDLSSTVAVGDNINDLPMIKAASVGVAVGNAVDGLKSVADYVSVSNNDGAVAEIIEKFGFR